MTCISHLPTTKSSLQLQIEHVILMCMFSEHLEKLKGMPDNWQKRLFFMGILTQALEAEKIRPIVVGGHAVEFYTLGGYSTGDIDIALGDNKVLIKILNDWGFEKEGRHWYSEKFDIAIEAPASSLRGNKDMITEVDVEGLTVYIIGVEDIIVDRLAALVHWNSLRDGEWAEEMLALHLDRIDLPYLKNRAKEEDTYDALENILVNSDNE